MRFVRWVILLGLLGLLWQLLQQYRYGVSGMEQVRALEDKIAGQVAENERLYQRNMALAADVKDLKDGDDAIEERARGELGMIKPGEIFYRVVDANAARNIDEELDAVNDRVAIQE